MVCGVIKGKKIDFLEEDTKLQYLHAKDVLSNKYVNWA